MAKATPQVPQVTDAPPSDAGGQKGISLLKEAEGNSSIKTREPVALFGLIAFALVLVTLIVGVLLDARITFLVLVVMAAQIFFTRQAVFTPETALKLLRFVPGK